MPPLPSRRRLASAAALVTVLVLVSSLVLAAGAIGAIGAPPPQSVCGPCNDGLVETARQHNLPLRVTESAATVRVHRDGSATWTVTSTVARDADPDPNAYPPNATLRDPAELRTNATLRRALVRGAVDESRDYLEPDRPDARLRSMELRNGTLRFTFHEPDVARAAPGGVLLYDEYHTRGLGSGWYVDVDRLEIVGPRNTTVDGDVPDAIGRDVATVDGRRLVLTGDPADPPRFDRRDVYVPFVPPGHGSDLLAALAVALATLPTVLATVAAIHLPGLVALVLALGLIHLARARRDGERRSGATLVGWAVLGVTLYLLPAFALYSPVQPHPMVTGLLSSLLVGYALLVAAGCWLLYPRVEKWV